MKYEPLKVEPYEFLRFWVYSEKDSSKRYLVDFNKHAQLCDCPNYRIVQHRQGGYCKHIASVIYFLGEQVIKQLQAKETFKKGKQETSYGA